MKNYFFLLAFSLIGHVVVHSQNETILLRQIDEQVWKPFMESFGKRNDTTFRSIHSKDVTRISIDDQSIIGYDQYFKKLPDSILSRNSAWKSTIEIRHVQRIVSSDRAFETGYYKTSSHHTTSGEKRVGYGKFTVLLRKENGAWKILMDSDSNEGTNEAIFQTGHPIE